MNAIHVKSLQIAYSDNRYSNQRKVLLDGLNVSFAFGECVAVVGPNGAGKSSLLRVLSGLQAPQKGDVFWKDEQLSEIPLSDRPRYLSIMFSSYERTSGMTVRDVVAMGRQPYTGIFGKLTESDWNVVDTALKRVGMFDFMDKPIGYLSDGEFRKVMLAKMWAQDAKVMLFDEPTAHLDVPSALEYMTLLKSAAADDEKAIVFSTHNLPVAFKISDKVLVLDQEGRTAYGTPSEIVKTTTFQSILGQGGIEVNPDDLSFKFNVL